MLKNNFEAKMYLKWLLVGDRNNGVAECYETAIGHKPLSAYEVITNEKYLSYCCEISKPFNEEEMGIEKPLIRAIIKEKLHSWYL